MVSVPVCPARWGQGESDHTIPCEAPLQVVTTGPPVGVGEGETLGAALGDGAGVFELGIGLTAG